MLKKSLLASIVIFLLSLAPLRAGTYSGGDGSTATPYRISSANNWQELMNTKSDWSKHFILTSNIDLDGVIATPVGKYASSFTGTFDGNNHIIRNVTMNLPVGHNYVGLFGYLDGGQIKNLGVENAQIIGPSYVGGLVGFLTFGSIISCHYIGSVSGYFYVGGLIGNAHEEMVTSCYVAGTVGGTEKIGGLVGGNNGSISGCSASNTVNGNAFVGGLVGHNSGTLTLCAAVGNVSGNGTVGGLVGYNASGNIYSCYAAGNSSGTGNIVGGLIGWNQNADIVSCYATGVVSGVQNVGGLCGYAIPDSYGDTGNFWDTDTSLTTTSAMGTGLTTLQMKTRDYFTAAGWDFLGESDNGSDNVWRMCVDGVDYPKLSWQYTQLGDFDCPDGVNTEDLARLSADWLTTYSTALYGADANGDSIVNLADFAILADHWLTGF